MKFIKMETCQRVEEKNKQTLLVFQLTLFMALFTACTNQASSQQQAKSLATMNDHQKTESRADTTGQLKFSTGVGAILEDSKGNFWFGSHQEGLCRFDGQTFTYFTEKEGLSNNQIRTIQEDTNGNIWFETANGITSYDGKRLTTHTGQDFRHGIANAFYSNINKASETQWRMTPNDLWFHGGGNAGTYKYDGKSLTYLAFPIPENDDEQNPSLVTGIAKGQNGRLWFAMYTGIVGYDGQSFIFINDESLGFDDETGKLHIRSIFEDSKGNLWIGNNGMGVLYYDGETTVPFTKERGLMNYDFLKYQITTPKPGTLARIFSIGEDKAGNIWFGTADTGAWRYDGVSLTNYTMKDGLTNLFVCTIYNDKKGGLWIGMGDGAVCKFNGKSFERMY